MPRSLTNIKYLALIGFAHKKLMEQPKLKRNDSDPQVHSYYQSSQAIPSSAKIADASEAKRFNQNPRWQGMAADMWCAATLMYYMLTEGKSSPQGTPAVRINPSMPVGHFKAFASPTLQCQICKVPPVEQHNAEVVGLQSVLPASPPLLHVAV
ncbi:hypothetical protein WJX74_006239 [Apatococcus lobatus]|uniref:Uncharacterized protein n=1 Tax=Apatococcus lobatus TaxID=904363 RepID=A0AAW1RYV5_9CHLO